MFLYMILLIPNVHVVPLLHINQFSNSLGIDSVSTVSVSPDTNDLEFIHPLQVRAQS